MVMGTKKPPRPLSQVIADAEAAHSRAWKEAYEKAREKHGILKSIEIADAEMAEKEKR
jgi:hypothetical protein